MARTGTVTDSNTVSLTGLTPGKRYAVTYAGTWNSGSISIKWNNGVNSAEIVSVSADGGKEIVSPYGQVDMVGSSVTSVAVEILPIIEK